MLTIYRKMKLIVLILITYPFIAFGQLPGSLDQSFNSVGQVVTSFGAIEDRSYDIAVQSSGKIVIGGFSIINGNEKFALLRYTEDGQIDSTFGVNGIVMTSFNANSSDKIWSLDIQDDDKIIAVGQTQLGSGIDIAVARYNENGVLDSTFGANGMVVKDFFNNQDVAYTVDVSMPSGRIFIGGQTGSSDDLFILCLNSIGLLDPFFNGTGFVVQNLGFSEVLYSLKVYQDSLIYCGGAQLGLTNQELLTMIYKTNGEIDSNYNSTGLVVSNFGYQFAQITSCVFTFDKKLLFGGFIGSNGSTTDFIIGRYLPDGTLDNTFNSTGYLIHSFGSGRDILNGIIVQSDSKIVVGGYTFNSISGFNFALMRILNNGLIDSSFGTNGVVETDFNFEDDLIFGVGVQPDSKIIVCGETYFGGKWNFATARYYSGLEVGINEVDMENWGFEVFPNPISGGILSFNNTLKNATITLLSMSGSTVKYFENISGNSLKIGTSLGEGLYILKITEKESSISRLLFVAEN